MLRKLAFWNSLVTGKGDATDFNNVGIWTNDGLFVRTSDTAPETSGATYRRLGIPSINNSGAVAYAAELNIGVGDATLMNHIGIWSDGQLLVRRGEIAAGTSERYDNLLGPTINDSGTVAYYGILDDVQDSRGIWTSHGLIAKSGDIALGTNGAKFSAFESAISINDSGTVAFQGVLAVGVGDTTSANEIGIWTTEGLVVRAGTELEVAPGETRALLAVFAQNQALANDGSIVFLAEFTDRTHGIFLATPVPEPSAFALSGVTLLVVRLSSRPKSLCGSRPGLVS